MTFELQTFNSNCVCNYRTCDHMFDNIINVSYPKYQGCLSLGYPKHSCILVSVIQNMHAVSVDIKKLK